MKNKRKNFNFKNWDVSPKEAVLAQKEMRAHVKISPFRKPISRIGGADVSMNMFMPFGFAGFVTLSYPELILKDHYAKKEKINFPYIPGLLSFREIPMLLKAWKKLKQKPDVLVVDGVGIAHPRRMGIATHLGLILGLPTIGCSKKVLYGAYEEPGEQQGDFTFITDPKTNGKIGAALRSKFGVKPIFISPGHLITLNESISIVKNCIKKHRLPEPTRLAHIAVNEYRTADIVKQSIKNKLF
jgi:deoxyribonuclease V